MNFLKKQIRFTSIIVNSLLIGLILAVFLSFLIIFLEPYDTNQFRAEYRILLLAGFGITFGLSYVFYSTIERIWYMRKGNAWSVSDEAISILIFFAFAGSAVFLYNHIIVNELSYSLSQHWWYMTHIVASMIPIVAPLLLFLRPKFGEHIVPEPPDFITITGENKNERLGITAKDLLYVKSLENYVDIIYLTKTNELDTQTFRQTLSKVHSQAPFLEKCHRSYLVNFNHVKSISGNSQSAKISLEHTDEHIPLSKTLYQKFKHRLSEE